jgi:hypothetical protein
MPIYKLYVKTHKVTGLKYLGYTSDPNPYQYLGSGKYWMRHLEKHGKDITTEILHECLSKEEIKAHGINYPMRAEYSGLTLLSQRVTSR